MNKTQIIKAARQRTDDTVEPFLFDDATYTGWANNAVEEACLRSGQLRDDSTSSVCQIALVAGEDSVALDPSIVVVRRAIITDGSFLKPLELTTYGEADLYDSRWEIDTPAEPVMAVMDMTRQTMRLSPIPERAYSLKLVVWRLPIADELLVNGSDVPTVLKPWVHKELEIWIAHEFYSKHDVDVYDPAMAAIELGEFTARVGTRPNAAELISRGRNRRRTSLAIFM